MKDLLYRVALTKIPHVGAVTAKNLVSYCGGVKEIFSANSRELQNIPGIGPFTAASILNRSILEDAEHELLFMEREGVEPIFYLDKQYPQRLRHYNDAPVMLYYKGTANLNHHRIVAIIGTRTPTPQGVAICEQLVEAFSLYQPVVISGLAYGIDVTAHRKSLDVGLETVAVLGHGLSMIYPPQHRKTALAMVNKGGLLTEFASHVEPGRENFPMRNRIVAALCDAVIVVETAQRGGSIITAQLANGYNKDVYAIPGRIKDKFSQGCNWLIKKNLATLIESAEDVTRLIGWEKNADDHQGARQEALFYALTKQEKAIIDLIQKNEEIGVDRLSYETRMSNSELASLLLNLEFQGLVRALPGKRYVLS